MKPYLGVISALSVLGGSAAFAAQAAGGGTDASPQNRRAYFGELHLHTTMSFDAWTFGTKLTPDFAYKFARGDTVMVPAVQVAKEQGGSPAADVPATRAWPLDFAAVTDHSEYLGAVAQLDVPNSPFSYSDLGRELRAGGRQAFMLAARAIFGDRGTCIANPESCGQCRRRLERRGQGRQRQLSSRQVHHVYSL